MPAERDVHVARLFEVVDDVEVPEIWEAVVAKVDTELTVPKQDIGGRRWWPAVAAAAVLLAVAIVVYMRLVDDPQTSDVPPVPAGGASNTLAITEHGAELDVTGSLVAGTVSIAVHNLDDGLHSTMIGRLVDGKTLEDARQAIASAGPDVDDALVGIVEYPSPLSALSAWRGPGDASTLTVSGVAAGEYVLTHVPRDDLARPIWSQAGVQPLTIAAGDPSTAPVADVTYTVRADGLDGPAQLPAGPTTISLVNDGTPRSLNVYRATQSVDLVGAFFLAGPVDWSQAPFDFFTSTTPDSEADRMISLELTPGEWIIDLRPDGQQEQPSRTVIVTVS